MYSSSPRFSSADEALLQKFLPFNNGRDDEDDDSDPYSSDNFRMYEFKVRRCTRSRSHDWTDCPFAHPGEKARRRDPRRYHYSGTVCPEFRRGDCHRGDSCEFAHGVFECWLHPARYRTEACKDGKNCQRKVCFFAHTPRQLRVLPINSSSSNSSSPEVSPMASKKKFLNPLSPNSKHCCFFCHSVNSSPKSTLLGMTHLSPPLSPPLSPAKHTYINGFSPISSYKERFPSHDHHFSAPSPSSSGMVSYKDSLSEFMEALNFHESSPISPISGSSTRNNLPWLDVCFNDREQQQQFILSPTTPSSSGPEDFFKGNSSKKLNDNGGSCSLDPDIGWVNELLM
ncbi:hypothetical protein UlMin_020721 [Ulmus minor]